MTSRFPAVLFTLALLSSALAWWLIAWPVVIADRAPKHVAHFSLVYVHMAGGTVMLVFGSAALFMGWTRRYFHLHRLCGYTYLAGGAVSSSLAVVLPLAYPHRGSISDEGIALVTLAMTWLVVSAMALRAIRNRRIDTHRAWAIRSYVLTWSFVLCRLVAYVPAVSSIDGAAITWLSWIVPFVVCELALQWKAGSRKLRP